MRVLIVGEGKSGTTALMASVVACLKDPAEIFEPQKMTPADLEPNPLVVKKLLLQWKWGEDELVDSFDKAILIVRDPRDRMISHLLYDAYNHADKLSESQRGEWLELLNHKVENPASVPMTVLISRWWQLTGTDMFSNYVRATDRLIRFQRQVAGDKFFLLSYEDYVDGSFAELNNYLGVTIEPAVVTGDADRVVRSKASGAWREWLTESDIDVFRPMTSRWLEQANYHVADWQLADPGKIDVETSVDYVRSLFTRRPVAAR